MNPYLQRIVRINAPGEWTRNDKTGRLQRVPHLRLFPLVSLIQDARFIGSRDPANASTKSIDERILKLVDLVIEAGTMTDKLKADMRRAIAKESVYLLLSEGFYDNVHRYQEYSDLFSMILDNMIAWRTRFPESVALIDTVLTACALVYEHNPGLRRLIKGTSVVLSF